MSSRKRKINVMPLAPAESRRVFASLASYIPSSIKRMADPQKGIPRLAKDRKATSEIEQVLAQLPTTHQVHRQDARNLELDPASIHLVITSPPYWTLKEYNRVDGQLGYIQDYESFLDELDSVWRHCFDALVPGGRVICVVGDVCLSRRQNNGRHTVVPLHASIQERCRTIGFDNLAPIIWHKIANVKLEAEGNGSGFLGKPYEPNSVIKNDIEFILMQRKPGGYRTPDLATRILSVIPEDKYQTWFQQIWTGVTGASTKSHPAPFPLELASRLIRMFSFVGDTVLDPFVGTATTALAAAQTGRNSVGTEIDPNYFEYACKRLSAKTRSLFSSATLEFHP